LLTLVKTDIIDSKKLALELAKGSLSGIYHRTADELYDRALIRKRQQLIKRKVQIHNQIKADLLFYGIKCEAGHRKYWSKQTIKEMKQMTVGTTSYQEALGLIIEEYEFLRKQINTIGKLLQQLSESDRYSKRMECLLSIPGIGKLSAITILLEIGDIERFPSAEKFASYLGLTPSEHSSGDVVRKGSLTGMGHSSLRKLLVEVSWVAIKKDPVLLEKFQRLSKGKSKCKAIVAVAKSLANRIRKILKDDEPYVIGVVG